MIDYGGIGLGLISDDVLWANRSGLGEFGHIVIDYNGRPCECGRRGCLATYASGRATLKRLAELSGDCTPGVGMAQLAHMAEQGDVDAQRALAEAGFYLGYGVTDIDCIVHPEFIVLGSSHPHLSEWYMKGLLKQIEEASTSIFGDDLSERVVLAEKGSYAIAYGGATLQIRKFYESPVSILEQLPDATELTTLLR